MRKSRRKESTEKDAALETIREGLEHGLRMQAGSGKESRRRESSKMFFKCELSGEKRIIELNTHGLRLEQLRAEIVATFCLEPTTSFSLFHLLADGSNPNSITSQDGLEKAIRLAEQATKWRSVRLKVAIQGGPSYRRHQQLFSSFLFCERPERLYNEPGSSSSSGRTGHGRYSPPPGQLPSGPRSAGPRSTDHRRASGGSAQGRSPRHQGSFIPEPEAAGSTTSPLGSRSSMADSGSDTLSSRHSALNYASIRTHVSDSAYERRRPLLQNFYPMGPSRSRGTSLQDDERSVHSSKSELLHGSQTFPRFDGVGQTGHYGTSYEPTNMSNTSSGSSGILNDMAGHNVGLSRIDTGLAQKLAGQEVGSRSSSSPGAPRSWKRGRLLGSGAFGQVFQAYDVEHARDLAVKVVACGPADNAELSKEVKALESEIRLLRNLSHESIVQYYGCERSADHLCIFMEYLPGGSVRDQVRQHGPLPEQVVRRYTRQILAGVVFLHASMIVHRDIKGANVLRDSHGNVKLSDFGASKRLHSIGTTVLKSVVGTPNWTAPEVIQGKGYGRRADIWSLACTVVEMLTAKPPYSDLEPMAVLYAIGSEPHPRYRLPANVSRTAVDFINVCFVKDHQTRPNAADLLAHSFVKAV